MSMQAKKFRTKQAIEVILTLTLTLPLILTTIFVQQAFEKCALCESLPDNKRGDVRQQLGRAKHRLEQQDAETPMPDMSNCAPS